MYALKEMTTRLTGGLLLLVGLVGVLPLDAQAQGRWQQTAVVGTPILDDQVSRVFLDTLSSVILRNPTAIAFKREPGDENTISFDELDNQLLDEGFDLSSANFMIISYKFEADQQGFRQNIEDIYFLYRPEGGSDIDTPIFYVAADQPMINSILVSKGTVNRLNQAVIVPFLDQMGFHQLQEAQILQVGNRIIRDVGASEDERRMLLQTIRKFLY